MNKEQLIQSTLNLTDRKQLSFFVDGEKARDRFNLEETKETEAVTDYASDMAFLLFKWISVAVYAKAKGPAKAKDILPVFSRARDKSGQEEEVIDKALKTIKDFLIGNGTVNRNRLCSSLFPFALEKEISSYPEEEKEIMKIASKQEEVIHNQVNLFTQTLFRCFLLKNSVNPNDISPDLENLSTGTVYYHHRRIIPTINGSYSLSSFKEEAIKGIKEASDTFPFEGVKEVMLFYPSVGLSISFPIKE